MIKINSKPIFINGMKTKYIIFEDGRVLNTKTNKYLKPSINNAGRRCILLYHDGRGYGKTVARWLALAFIPTPNNDDPCNYEADHIDGDYTNDVLSNIQWLTPEENNLKRNTVDGKSNKGINNGMAKIHDERIVRKIIRDIAKGLSTSNISKKYNVPKPTITSIRTGYAWKHISNEYDISKYSRHCNKYSDELKRQIYNIINSNNKLTHREICDIVGIKYNSRHESLIKNIKSGKYKIIV